MKKPRARELHTHRTDEPFRPALSTTHQQCAARSIHRAIQRTWPFIKHRLDQSNTLATAGMLTFTGNYGFY